MKDNKYYKHVAPLPRKRNSGLQSVTNHEENYNPHQRPLNRIMSAHKPPMYNTSTIQFPRRTINEDSQKLLSRSMKLKVFHRDKSETFLRMFKSKKAVYRTIEKE